MLVVLVVLLVAAGTFARLGIWQLDRALARGEARSLAEAQAVLTAPPVDLAAVLAPQTTFTSDMVGRHVSVTGTFGPDQLLVTGRVHDGTVGDLVLSPLTVEGTGAVLPVVRGWVPDAAAPAATERLRPGRSTWSAGCTWGRPPARPGCRTARPMRSARPSWSTAGAVRSTPATWCWSRSTPAQDPGLALMGEPVPGASGVDWRNLGYALQWWMFGIFAVALWWRMVGRRGERAGGGGRERRGLGRRRVRAGSGSSAAARRFERARCRA